MTLYKVTGPVAYAGHPPGEEFEDDLDEAAERRAVARGSIRVVRRKPKESDIEEEEEVSDA